MITRIVRKIIYRTDGLCQTETPGNTRQPALLKLPSLKTKIESKVSSFSHNLNFALETNRSINMYFCTARSLLFYLQPPSPNIIWYIYTTDVKSPEYVYMFKHFTVHSPIRYLTLC